MQNQDHWRPILPYIQLMRVHKPIGFLLLLWPTLIALWIAGEGRPDPTIVAVFILGTFIMRSAGCVINDIFDRRFDGHVLRTKDRPLVTGLISTKKAVFLFASLMTMAFFLVLQLNIQTVLLSFVAAFLAMLYPLMKRITHGPQLVLGIAFAWSIPMAFMALQRTVPNVAWVLFSATVLWVIAYDTEYAMSDRDEDLKIGIKSTAIWFGKFDKIIIFLLQLNSLTLFITLGNMLQLGYLFFISIAVAGICMLYQQYLIKNRISTKCFQAFLHNNYVGALFFLALLLSY